MDGIYARRKKILEKKKCPQQKGVLPPHCGLGKPLVQGGSPGTFIESDRIICMPLLLINRENVKKAKKMTFF